MQLPPGVIPVRDLSTEDVLYGSRVTTFRFELLEHDPVSGVDSLSGVLDGVKPSGSLTWLSGRAVRKAGTLTVVDLAVARGGMIRAADVNWFRTRIRPVMVVEGLPEIPLGVYVVTGDPEQWSSTGREIDIEMHEKSITLVEDLIDSTFVAPAGVPILSVVQSVVASAGEQIDVGEDDARVLAQPMVWPAADSKLRIVNDLLEVLGYNALWMDGGGAFRATPWVAPAARSIRYSMLNDAEGNRLARALSDGAQSIYSPDWTRDRDKFGVPNRVIAVQTGEGDSAPLVGVATNENPDSPFSFQSRGRWITRPVEDVEVPDYSGEADPVAATVAFLNARAQQSLTLASAVQDSVSITCLPIPVELLDAVVFASTPAGVEGRHTVRSATVPLTFDGLMKLELQQVTEL